ncbi:hypothetical protein BHM03_00024983 [Ensete ventricosum]|nr:hypothetical protein BHM03_00024983 [Ensete ventricosum]
MSSASSHFESRSVEMSTCRSRALSRPSGDSRLTALVSVFAGATLADSETAYALVAMQFNFDVESTTATRRLVEMRKNYFIPSKYELHAPLPGERPYDAFPNGFSLLTYALEVGLRFSLHPMIKACLEGWQISPSHMAPNSWCYLVAFLWECFGSGVMTTRDLFMTYFRLSQGQADYYLTAHAGFKVGGVPSSNKGRKSQFFFVSYHQSWSFPIKWTFRTMNNSVLTLSIDETELVEILWGSFLLSRGRRT